MAKWQVFADAVSVASVFGTFADDVLTLKHPYPGFDVEAGWTAKAGDVVLTFTGSRTGQRIPCSRG